MARKRDPKRDKAFKLWQGSGGKMQPGEIAVKLDVPVGTVRAWKKRDDWDALQNECNATQNDCNATREDRAPDGKFLPGNKISVGYGAPPGNGNSIGHKSSSPLGNHNGMRHGLYAKYLPRETRKLATEISEMSPIDILWGNICIKYAAIMRSQKIMYVKGKGEIIKHIKSEGENSTTYELQYAWDRQAAFLNAQAKAMQSLAKMIKQYDELCKSDFVTEEQQLRIAKLKSDIAINEAKVSVEEDGDAMQSFINALKGQAAQVWDE